MKKDAGFNVSSHTKSWLIVTSVLKNHNDALILRRSMKVKTMREKWAGVSGYLEKNEDLLSRALTEIHEETQITNNDLTLRKIFNKLNVQIHDELRLIIQPFCFVSKTRKVILDWEHSDYCWINYNEIDNFDFVPRFKEIILGCLQDLY